MPEAPIAITGMHRSGTSMITRALHDSGLHLVGTSAEELIDAADDNPEGFWENKAIVACNDDLLEATGGAWDHPPALPPVAVDDPRVAAVAERATAALAGLRQHEHWGFKDPRTCLTAAYWLDLEPELRFIICVRHPLEVALSLKRRNQSSYSLGLALWERYYATVLEQVPAERRVITHYDTFFVDPEGELARLCAFAGLEPTPPRVRSDLRHHTIGVDLGDAGASAGLRALYAELCRMAGTPPPREAPVDEGRVRRLVLDGSVAQRHAEQRQAAIERLQEREEQFRAEHAAAEEALRQRVRALEQERASLEADHRAQVRGLHRERAALEADHRAQVRDLEAQLVAARRDATDGLRALQQQTGSTLAALEATLARIDQRTEATAAQVERARQGVLTRAARRLGRPVRRVLLGGRRRAAPTARRALQQLPPPAQATVRRVRRLARRGIQQPGPTARALVRRAGRGARAGATHLPPPAQQVLRRGRAVVQRGTQAPGPAAKALVRRLPDSVERSLRQGWATAQRARRAARSRALVEPAPKPGPTPKGPAPRLWMQAYEQLVAEAWRGDEPWVVVTPGSPREVRDARPPRATTFPATRDGRPLAEDLAHVAQLEALRYDGHHHLVVPEGSRPWFLQQAELRDHVVGTYATVVDCVGAGAAFDLARSRAGGPETLRAAVDRLTAGTRRAPSVLDWTSLGLADELPDLATFAPPAGDRLPYLDDSVDVVAVLPDGDHDEARRVAVRGVVTVAAGSSGPEVRRVEALAEPAAACPSVLVWSPATDDRWAAALEDRATAAGATVHLGSLDAAGLAGLGDHDVVVAVEPHVLPLPGSLEAVADAALGRPGDAVTGKVLRRDGRLEAAGGMVFFDRSVALVAAGSPDVRAPWHEYVRPVCWGAGVVAATADCWRAVPAPEAVSGRAFLREWCAAAWAAGSAVTYHPEVAAVRVAGDGGEPSTPLRASAWQRTLDLRPARPRELSDGAWRFLLAHDDVEACRG
ncbi:MAG: sulfotransferase [Acidimicrobiia bacterium]